MMMTEIDETVLKDVRVRGPAEGGQTRETEEGGNDGNSVGTRRKAALKPSWTGTNKKKEEMKDEEEKKGSGK